MVAMVVHDTTTIGDAIAIVYDALLQLLYAAEEAESWSCLEAITREVYSRRLQSLTFLILFCVRTGFS